MKNSITILIISVSLIMAGYVLGCESSNVIVGNEKSIKTEEINAERIFTKEIVIIDKSDNPVGIMMGTPDGSGFMLQDKNQKYTILLHIEKDGPKITMSDTQGDHHIRLWVRETGPSLILLCKGEAFVALSAIDWETSGAVFTFDKHGKTTGSIPWR